MKTDKKISFLPKINFVIPTYNHGDKLVCCVSSIVCQTNPNWTIHIIDDCGDTDGLKKVQKIYGNDERITCTILSQRMNDWGHTPRNVGLEECKDELICMTGGDNYYTPTFVDEILKVFNKNIRFVYCNMVHNWDKGQYYAIDSKPEYGKIDIGNAVLRTKYAKYLKLDTTFPQSDWKLFNEYLTNFAKPEQIIKINKYLYVHN